MNPAISSIMGCDLWCCGHFSTHCHDFFGSILLKKRRERKRQIAILYAEIDQRLKQYSSFEPPSAILISGEHGREILYMTQRREIDKEVSRIQDKLATESMRRIWTVNMKKQAKQLSSMNGRVFELNNKLAMLGQSKGSMYTVREEVHALRMRTDEVRSDIRMLRSDIRMLRSVIQPPESKPSSSPYFDHGNYMKTANVLLPRPTLSPYFVGRKKEKYQLLRILEIYGSAAITQVGSTGKTQLMVSFVEHVEKERLAPGGVFWITANGNVSHAASALADFFERFTKKKLRKEDRIDPKIIVLLLGRELRFIKLPWLLCVDSVDDPTVNAMFEKLITFTSSSLAKRWVIVTSRQDGRESWRKMSPKQKLKLKPLSEEESMTVLWRWRASISKKDERDKEIVQQLKFLKGSNSAEYYSLQSLAGDNPNCGLRGLPLALAQAGSYMSRVEVSFSKFVRLYSYARSTCDADDVLNRIEDFSAVTPRHDAIGITWKMDLESHSDCARQVLRAIASFDVTPIPEILLKTLIGKSCEEKPNLEQTSIDMVEQELMNCASLLEAEQAETGSKFFSLHQLIRQFVIADVQVNPALWQTAVNQAFLAIHDTIELVLAKTNHSLLKLPDVFGDDVRELVPHASSILLHCTERLFSTRLVRLYEFCIHVLLHFDLPAAELHCVNLLQVLRQVHGKSADHSDIANVLHNLGKALAAQGNKLGADRKFEEALHMSRRLGGLRNPGKAYPTLDDNDGAYRKSEKKLQTFDRLDSEDMDHPNVASSLGSVREAHMRDDRVQSTRDEDKEVEHRSSSIPSFVGSKHSQRQSSLPDNSTIEHNDRSQIWTWVSKESDVVMVEGEECESRTINDIIGILSAGAMGQNAEFHEFLSPIIESYISACAMDSETRLKTEEAQLSDYLKLHTEWETRMKVPDDCVLDNGYIQENESKSFILLIRDFWLCYDEHIGIVFAVVPGSPLVLLRDDYCRLDALSRKIPMQQIYFLARRLWQFTSVDWEYKCLAQFEQELSNASILKLYKSQLFKGTIIDLHATPFNCLAGCKVGYVATKFEKLHRVGIEMFGQSFGLERSNDEIDEIANPVSEKHMTLENIPSFTDHYVAFIGGSRHPMKLPWSLIRKSSTKGTGFTFPGNSDEDRRITWPLYNFGFVPQNEVFSELKDKLYTIRDMEILKNDCYKLGYGERLTGTMLTCATTCALQHKDTTTFAEIQRQLIQQWAKQKHRTNTAFSLRIDADHRQPPYLLVINGNELIVTTSLTKISYDIKLGVDPVKVGLTGGVSLTPVEEFTKNKKKPSLLDMVEKISGIEADFDFLPTNITQVTTEQMSELLGALALICTLSNGRVHPTGPFRESIPQHEGTDDLQAIIFDIPVPYGVACSAFGLTNETHGEFKGHKIVHKWGDDRWDENHNYETPTIFTAKDLPGSLEVMLECSGPFCLKSKSCRQAWWRKLVSKNRDVNEV